MTDLYSDLPDLWSEQSLRPYLGEVKRRHGVVETLALPSMRDLPPVQIETLFVPPVLAQSTVSADTDPEMWPEGKSLLAELQEYRRLVVLGDPGGGKTTLSNWLAWRLASGLSSPLPDALKNRVPIPCVLRDMPVELFSNDVTLVDLAFSVSDKLLGPKSNIQVKSSLAMRVSRGAYVLILDGIDEIPVNHRHVVAGWIKSASEQAGCVLATSRIVGYEDGPVDGFEGAVGQHASKKYPEKKFDAKYSVESIQDDVSHKILTSARWAEGSESKEPVKWAQIRYLMPFDQGRIASFAENWYRQRCMSHQEATEKTTDLLAALSQSDVTQKLARTPNLLSLMAIVHRERAHLPDGKALLYEEIVNAYINTIDKQRKIEPGDILAQYGWKDRKAWLAYVGFKMQATRNEIGGRDAGILAEEADVEQWLREAMETTGVPSPDQAAITFLSWVARRSGLLLPRGEARYAFVHLSFQEYFCACYLDSCIVRPAFIRDKLSSEDNVTKKKLSDWSHKPYWFETLIFLFELLSAERDSEWVDDLVRIVFGEEVEEFAPYDLSAELASRIIKNKHVKISSILRDNLAVSLGSSALNEWESRRFSADKGVLTSLLDSGYCVVFNSGGVSSGVGENRSLQAKFVRNLEDVYFPERVRILIIHGSSFLETSVFERFINVKYLHVKGVELSDVSFLHQLKRLKVLQLCSLGIKDVNPVASLTELTHLEFHDLAINDLQAISKLKLLSTLELHELKVSDLSPLADLKALVYLSIKDLDVNDVRPLASLKSLNTLYLNGLPKVDLSPVGALKSLLYLKIDGVDVLGFEFLNRLKKLNNLDLRRLKISDLTVIGNMRELDTLYIIGCDVPSLAPLGKLSGLHGLGLMYTSVPDIDFIGELNSLSNLYIAGVEVADLTPVSSLKKLMSFTIDVDKVPDLAPLAECKSLRFVEIECKSSVDVLPLASLTKLYTLNIKSKSVSNLQLFDAIESVMVTWEEA
ncbi:NACHT domain-containing protein [Pseudomonas alvandae]|uniref:NACHT domain-containing protein n=1 Tax=Pseudomonas canavaninivorans TaxID=2842348 RepID=UPI00215FFEEF|nr:NACHT domain-containing protein [Pseudomonas canavaninivorans]UVM74362.1 NACHT domain-containing protein [Pseudomonas canavaninivorans]